jgi:hypothetical protein
MMEIAENLHRSELTKLEHDEQVAEWIRLVEQEQAERDATKEGELQLSQVGTVDRGGRAPDGNPREGGIRAAARELHIDKNQAHRAMKVDSLAPEAKEAASTADLLTVAGGYGEVVVTRGVAAQPDRVCLMTRRQQRQGDGDRREGGRHAARSVQHLRRGFRAKLGLGDGGRSGDGARPAAASDGQKENPDRARYVAPGAEVVRGD